MVKWEFIVVVPSSEGAHRPGADCGGPLQATVNCPVLGAFSAAVEQQSSLRQWLWRWLCSPPGHCAPLVVKHGQRAPLVVEGNGGFGSYGRVSCAAGNSGRAVGGQGCEAGRAVEFIARLLVLPSFTNHARPKLSLGHAELWDFPRRYSPCVCLVGPWPLRCSSMPARPKPSQAHAQGAPAARRALPMQHAYVGTQVGCVYKKVHAKDRRCGY